MLLARLASRISETCDSQYRCKFKTADIFTLMGLPSTGIPLQVWTALVALSERTNVMSATPLLSPLGPYDRSTLLTAPTVLAKYSYLSKIWLVIWISYISNETAQICFPRSAWKKRKDPQNPQFFRAFIRGANSGTASEQRALVVTATGPVSGIQLETFVLGQSFRVQFQ